ncbi:FadR/GntR family transcriptional regulator [Amycolatopsis sp. FDAARGOS 1241]|uniref:FadR/GntR family transcriptional regulator n=1 Tax=Amycolatopsis sp. FDAARGOS 1241 TaxID=2778070 RepID=UPI001950334A|nr:FCD domain-containing protein [Amycolatopsis sp. FDAARGOS 1241]QRP50049.1 FadR family transcriptional regulator [Amycolatopsis sp. FDAARGOS 1241]
MLDVPEGWDVVLRRAELVSVIEARMAIETQAAGLAAERGTPTELRARHRALSDRAARRSDLGDHADADTAFLRAIVAAVHNPIPTELFDDFVPRSREAMISMLCLRGTFGSDADHDPHTELLDAITFGDARSTAETKPGAPGHAETAARPTSPKAIPVKVKEKASPAAAAGGMRPRRQPVCPVPDPHAGSAAVVSVLRPLKHAPVAANPATTRPAIRRR